VVPRVENVESHFDNVTTRAGSSQELSDDLGLYGLGRGASRVSIRGSTCRSLLVTMLIRRSEYGNSLPQSMQQTYVSPVRSRCGHVVFG